MSISRVRGAGVNRKTTADHRIKESASASLIVHRFSKASQLKSVNTMRRRAGCSHKNLDSMFISEIGRQNLPRTYWQKRIWLAVQPLGQVLSHRWEAGRSIRVPQQSCPESVARQIMFDELSPRRNFRRIINWHPHDVPVGCYPNTMKGDRKNEKTRFY